MEPPGKQPKSKEEIRGALQSLSGAGPERGAGPKSDGLSDDDRINIASFRDRKVAREFQDRLHEAAIPSMLRGGGSNVQVFVDYEDRVRANEILAQYKLANPKRRQTDARRRHDYLIFGGLMGLTIGTIFLAGAADNPRAWIAPLPFMAVGCLSGHFVDQVIGGIRRSGRFVISSWEFLVLAPIPALLAFIWHWLPTLITE